MAEQSETATKAKRSLNRGSNQQTVRSYNERLILQLIRAHGELTKAEATRATSLSANAVSVIFRALEEENLIVKKAPIRGNVGQPSVPVSLNPDAKIYAGLKLGRESYELVLINFTGSVIAADARAHPYPAPQSTLEFMKSSLPKLLKSARTAKRNLAGFGLAMPFELWSWPEELGAPPGALDVWRDMDIAQALSDSMALPNVLVQNDGTAACSAELTFHPRPGVQDAIYLFVGTMIGGGVVLNGSVFPGRSGSAGGFGPLRVPGGEDGQDRLIDHASLYTLDRMIKQAGGDPMELRTNLQTWQQFGQVTEQWLDRAARGIAHAIVSSLAIIDFQAVIIDGSFPSPIRQKLIEQVQAAFSKMDLQGLPIPEISAGHWGPIARAVGAAALPMNHEYAIDQNTLLRR